MSIQDHKFDEDVPATSTAIPSDIIAQQRSMGVPELLLKMQVSPTKFAAGKIKPREYLDGMVFPAGTASLVAMEGASGKSTGIRGAAASAADNGLFAFFGERQHNAPLKVFLLHGEESADDVVESFAIIPGALAAYHRATAAGRFIVSSLGDFQEKLDQPEEVFDKEGRLTNLGGQIFAAIEQWKPDLVVLDTIGSMSEAEYLDGVSSKNMVKSLNRLCARSGGAAVIGFLHLTKDAGSKVRADMTSAELQSLSRGSAMLKNSARNLIVATKAPVDMYPGIQIEEGDQLWVGTVKCNIAGAPYNGKLFPFVREKRRMTLAACGESGKALADEVQKTDRAATRALIEYLPHLIRAASDMHKPFPASSSSRSKFNLQKMLVGPMSTYFEETLNASLITGALEVLVREGKIVEASNSRSAGGLVYCYPGGPFAEQAEYEARTASKLKVREGDYPIEELKNRMHELHDSARDGAEAPAWVADAEAAEADREQADAAKQVAADEKAAKARARADQSAADEARKAAAKAAMEAKRIATMQRDAAKRELATAEDEIEKYARPLKIARANLNAARVRAEEDKSPDAAAKIDEFIAVLADLEGEAQAAEVAKNDATSKLEAAEAELIRISEKVEADRGGPDLGSADVAGCRSAKALKPERTREVVRGMCADRAVSI